VDTLLDVASPWLTGRLLVASLQGSLAIGIVWIVCRVRTRVPPALQVTLWWIAGLGLLVGLVPLPAIEIPVLPPPAITTGISVPAGAVSEPTGAVTYLPASPPGDVPTPLGRTSADDPWPAGLLAIWLLVLAVHGARLLGEWRRLRGLVGRADRPDGADVRAAESLASAIGLSRVPPLRVSDEITAPLVVGCLRPVVLLPTGDGPTGDPDDRRMALCHELMHVRRHDLALGWIPALAARLFFFHPLAHLMAREYAAAREAACDAAVVRALDVSPAAYGRLLVRFGTHAPPRALAAGGGSPSMFSLRRRLHMLQHTPMRRTPRPIRWGLVTLMLVALVPFDLGARAPAAAVAGAQPGSAGQAERRPPVPPAPPELPATAAAPSAAAPPVPAAPAPPEVQAAPPAAPAPPAPPAPRDPADARRAYQDAVRAYALDRLERAASDPLVYQAAAQAYRDAVQNGAQAVREAERQQTQLDAEAQERSARLQTTLAFLREQLEKQAAEFAQVQREMARAREQLATQREQLAEAKRTLDEQQVQLREMREQLLRDGQDQPN